MTRALPKSIVEAEADFLKEILVRLHKLGRRHVVPLTIIVPAWAAAA
jgi:hypothetical protein